MKEIKADIGLVAACGLYCGACGKYLNSKCPGCRKNEKASWCKVRACCIENKRATCAECKDHSDLSSCKKLNNFIAKIIGFILKSDRKDCLCQIREKGLSVHAAIMTEKKMRYIKRKK